LNAPGRNDAKNSPPKGDGLLNQLTRWFGV